MLAVRELREEERSDIYKNLSYEKVKEAREKFKLNIEFKNLDKNLALKALKTEKEMLEIIKSEHFYKNFMMVLRLRDYQKAERSKFKNYSPEQIYLTFMRSVEVLGSQEVDYEMDAEVVGYFSLKTVMGWTNKNIKQFHVNVRYLRNGTTKTFGSLNCHEHSHKLGFDHDFYKTKDRPNSISYLLNLIYEITHDEIYKKRYEEVCFRSWKTFFRKRCYKKEIYA